RTKTCGFEPVRKPAALTSFQIIDVIMLPVGAYYRNSSITSDGNAGPEAQNVPSSMRVAAGCCWYRPPLPRINFGSWGEGAITGAALEGSAAPIIPCPSPTDPEWSGPFISSKNYDLRCALVTHAERVNRCGRRQ